MILFTQVLCIKHCEYIQHLMISMLCVYHDGIHAGNKGIMDYCSHLDTNEVYNIITSHEYY